MASPGTIRFVEINTTPAAPPVGSAIVYIKTDNVIYLQDSSGIEVPLGTASGITSLTGEATGTGPGAAVITLSNSAVIGKVLTGFTSGPNSAVLATDTLLQAIQKLQAQIASASSISALTGDVTASGSGSVAATVASVGGSSAANVHAAELLANAATSSNTASTIVKRDASGNFTAGTITANLTGNASTATSAGSFSGSLSGDVTGTQSSTVVSYVGGKAASAVSNSVDDTSNATSINTASTIVKRDASGNFAANTITANLTGTASGNESPITATTSADYYRGDKTFQPLNKTAVGLNNVVNVDTTTTANITDSTNKRFVTDANLTTIAAQTGTNTGDQTATTVPNTPAGNIASTNVQDALNELDSEKEAVANKSTSIVTDQASNIKYPSVKSVYDWAVGAFQTALGFTPEDVTNKATNLTSPDNTTYPTTLAVDTALSGKQATGNYITALTGDVTASGPGSSAATVAFVGTSSAANVHSAELLANAATNLNTASAIVKRDSSGNFSAGTITANLTGAASSNLLKAGDTMSGYFRSSVVTLTDAATIAVDASLGNIFKVTLGGNRTLGTPTNPLDGQRITFQITQDGTGGRTLAYSSGYNLGVDMIGISLSTTAGATDYIGAIYRAATSTWNIIAISRGY